MKLQSINRYEAYKDSGVEWLGQNIPSDWKVMRIKDLAFLQSGNSIVSEQIDVEGDFPVYGGNGLRGFYSKYTNEGSFILIGRQGALCGNINYAEGKFWASEHAVVAYLQRAVHMKWFGELLRIMNLNQYSLAAAQPGLAMDRIKRLLLPVPPFQEQQAIADYLDTKTAQIDYKIDLYSKKATQYSKLKQSLINETVTRGLDKTVPMKDSGVEWIGEVPVHWDVKKLSQSFSQIGSGTTPKSGADIYYESGTTNWINTGDLNDGILYSCKRTITNKALRDHSLTIYPAGSIIIAMYGATIGKVSISMIDGCTNQACCVLNKSKIINVKFLFYWFISKREFIISLSYGGGQPNISQDTIKSLRIISPCIAEQTAIATYLDEKTTHIDRIVSTINTQIDKLKELRKTLINDVVTGKIRVA